MTHVCAGSCCRRRRALTLCVRSVPEPNHAQHFRSIKRPPTDDELISILRVWRAVWLIVSARRVGADELTRAVRELGVALRTAIAKRDRRAVLAAVDNMRVWLDHLGGAVMAQLTAPFRRLL